MEFEPRESRVGTTVTVTGTGWIASNGAPGAESANISVDYFRPAENKSDTSVRANPDADGNFVTTIKVPLNAAIPSTNRVEVSYDDEDEKPVVGSGSPPGSRRRDRTIAPTSGPGGTIASVTGGGFKAFTTLKLVEVGSVEVQPRPTGASAGRDGILQTVAGAGTCARPRHPHG